ncbi:nickel-dependent lactate racemase [Streptomyces galbus]|uniref:Nickel-dependent lactate racemase n=1 Tax=Streptomyces galbus TaxID=33898 RepID=A0A4U5WZE7_STRGB|nr:nickel-dependent lactate racemase [Streptomyces galbus]TKT08025.1 nickel-dependent lactate racemase [Streptomyces galbus]GHD42302.1 hypothetical protein GCM10010335_45060 [Streptomyces galbus]
MSSNGTVELAYGEVGLDITYDPDVTTVVQPVHHPAAADQRAAIVEALRSPVAGLPLRKSVHPGQTVAISACDGTRPQPRHLMIPAILDELSGIVRLEDITVIVATGTHRGNSEEELRRMFGDDVVNSVRIINHDARDSSALQWMGTFGDGVPVWLNRTWVDADIRITTGFVEPHFFAGFSGGPKLVAPGLAALETVLVLHDARRIGDPHATWGVTHGNPVHDDIRVIAEATGVTFSLDVVLNRDQQVVAAFGGQLGSMHRAATAAARQLAMRAVDAPFDVVVTTNSGYPLDQNLYQAVKGMSAAHQVTRPGGTIICAAECRDGFPDHGSYREVLASAVSPQALLQEIQSRTTTVPDQWQVQIQARVQASSRVIMHTSYLSRDDLATAHLEATEDVTETLARALAEAGTGARACILPEGPQTIPYLAGGTR